MELTRQLSLEEVAVPAVPARGWVLVRPLLAGISSDDLRMLEQKTSPLLTAVAGDHQELILGHEVVGVVEEVTRTGARFSPGDRVILHSPLSCYHKGLSPCARCLSGDIHVCENRDRAGPLCSGHAIGASPTTGGGWGELLAAHEDMLVAAESIPDQRAVLIEATATAIHACDRWKGTGETAAVIGTGAESALMVATLARLYSSARISVLSMRENPDTAEVRSAELYFSTLGAGSLRVGSAGELLDAMADSLSARRLLVEGDTLPILDGGLGCVVDTMATTGSIDLSVRLLRAGGLLIIMGAPEIEQVPWPLLASREITIKLVGTSGGARHRKTAFLTARDWLADESFRVSGVVTHRFALSEFSTALTTARQHSLLPHKVVFQSGLTPLRNTPPEDTDDEGAPIFFGLSRKPNAADQDWDK